MTARRWITVLGAALVVSLALNLFFGGVIAGHRLGQRGQLVGDSPPIGVLLRCTAEWNVTWRAPGR